jgi:hypothetical protein
MGWVAILVLTYADAILHFFFIYYTPENALRQTGKSRQQASAGSQSKDRNREERGSRLQIDVPLHSPARATISMSGSVHES